MTPDPELLRRLARSSGLRVEEVHQFVQWEVVTLGGGQPRPSVLRRLRRARRLRRDLGLSMDAVAIIVRLLDRIEALEGDAVRRGRVRTLGD